MAPLLLGHNRTRGYRTETDHPIRLPPAPCPLCTRQVVVSTAAKHAYVVYGRTFITCDTPATLKMKIDAAAALGLGGLMVRGRQATCAETLQTDVHSPRTHLHKKQCTLSFV